MGVTEFWRLFVLVSTILLWVCATLWLGLVTAVRGLVVLAALPGTIRRTVRCTRGHEVDAYGVFLCRCGALVEGHVFAHCGVCHQPGGYTPCPMCGLPVRNRFLGGA